MQPCAIIAKKTLRKFFVQTDDRSSRSATLATSYCVNSSLDLATACTTSAACCLSFPYLQSAAIGKAPSLSFQESTLATWPVSPDREKTTKIPPRECGFEIRLFDEMLGALRAQRKWSRHNESPKISSRTSRSPGGGGVSFLGCINGKKSE